MSNNLRVKKINALWTVCCILTVVSCGLTKKVGKQEMDKKVVEQIVSKTKRKGDSVIYQVPNIRFKDTTVYTYNHVGTRLETRYDSEGYIDQVRCIEAALEQFTLINRELATSIKNKEKEEKSTIDKTLVYGILMILVFGLLYVISRLESLRLR